MKSLLAVCATVCVAANSHAQDTTLFVDLVEQSARVGDTVYIPAIIRTDVDSVAGFELEFVLDRPNVIEFRPEYFVEPTASLCADWDLVDGSVPASTFVRIVGLAETDTTNGFTLPIPPGTLGEILVYVVVHVPCTPDPFSNYEVELVPSGFENFATPQGNLIEPTSVRSAKVTIQPPLLGDIDRSGSFDLVDVVSSVKCAFRNDCPGCGPVLADVNCSGAVDIVDVVKEIDYIFRGGAALVCP
jgi:hypothetical protein